MFILSINHYIVLLLQKGDLDFCFQFKRELDVFLKPAISKLVSCQRNSLTSLLRHFDNTDWIDNIY